MKKILIPLAALAILLGTTLTTTAQVFISKGSLLGGGGFQFTTGSEKYEFASTSSKDKLTSISLNPFVSYYVADNLGVGAMLFVETSKETNDDTDAENSSSGIVFGPAVRYYFAEGPFAQAFVGFGSDNSKFTSGGSTFESKYGIFMYEAGVGYSVRVSDTILLDPMLGYQGRTRTDKDDSDLKYKYGGIFLRLGFVLILKNP